MINVSKTFRRNLYEGNNKFLMRLVITLQDNTRLEVENDNIMSNNGILFDDAVSEDDDFTALGSTIINACDVTLYNNTNLYSNYEFINAKVVLYVGLNLNDTVEEFKKGTYTVDDAVYGDYTVSLSLVDEMAQFDRPYSESQLRYPATLNDIVLNACSVCNVPLANNSLQFPHRDFSVAKKPSEESTTFREVLGWAATIAGCFARCNVDGELELKWFNINALDTEQEATYDGGTFNPWSAGNTVDGGTFNPWSTGDTVDGGEFTDARNVHYISSLYSQSLGVDDVVITGVKIIVEIDDIESDEDTKEFTRGTDNYLIEVADNKFITVDNAPTVLNWLATLLIGTRFRKCNVQHLTDPTIEAGDVALLWDTKDVEHRILITRVDFSPTSLQTVVSGAASVGRNSATRFSNQTKSYVATRRQLREQHDTYEQALEQLAEKVDNANGLFETDVEQQDGSIIKYYHNKPELEDSDIQIVISNVGITVTSNGTAEHPTWYGLTVDGTLIASIMNTIGINFDWGVGGELIIKKGNDETFYVNASTGEVRIVAKSFSLADGSTINSIANSAVQTFSTNLTQQEIFNRLTNNGQTQGIYLQNGKLYINGSYVSTGILQDTKGNMVWNLTTGAMTAKNFSIDSDNFDLSNTGILSLTGSGLIKTTSGDYKTELSGGKLKLYYKNKLLGTIEPAYSGSNQYISFTNESAAKGIIIGTNNYPEVITLNDGLENLSEKLILSGGVYSYGPVTANDYLYMDGDRNTYIKHIVYSSGRYVINLVPFVLIGNSTFVANSTLTVGGSIYAYGAVTENSDERRKIIDTDDWKELADDFIQNLDAIKYQWKDGDDKQHHIGLGAQRTEKTLKDSGLDVALVQHIDDIYGVNYSELAPMMIPSLQKDRQKITKLEKRIEELENRISQLEKLLLKE